MDPATFQRRHAGTSKKCGCTAHIQFGMHVEYARQSQLFGVRSKPDTLGPDLHRRHADIYDEAINAWADHAHQPGDGTEQPAADCGGSHSDARQPGDGTEQPVADGGGSHSDAHQPGDGAEQPAANSGFGAYGGGADSSGGADRSGGAANAIPTTVYITMDLRHTGHQPLSPVDLLSQPVHPDVAAKVRELSQLGMTFNAMQPQVTAFATDLALRLGVEPNRLDARFFPRDEVLRNMMARAVREQRIHKIDQGAVRLLAVDHF
ncbi:hypothetical protein GPECTOR_11g204 [Gonium pectorale]|uniref:Uncharacterized protein n=1 Tax=Gonium pectorale TaxID=33097 RepID=A0A150GQZ0_GONPE|nr:hypothetical protein GPECTOR_11g204 [Gonium pectorale]|eukprot:KXZ51760.1 hypothetical protein GPECTOR_11g204 [Gonium pectorale]